MGEMFSETGSSPASDSVAGSDGNDNTPHMAKDNAAQSSSDASPEDYYDGAGFSLEVGEAGPAGFSDEVNFPDAGGEVFPEVGDEVTDSLPGTEASQAIMADSSGNGSGSDIWERTITPDFNKPEGPKDGTGDKGDSVKKGGGDQQPLTPPGELTPEHTPPDTFINPKTPAP